MDETFAWLRKSRETHCILGLRDVLDDRQTVHAEWTGNGSEDCILENYDAVWVYGDPKIYDTLDEYAFSPEIRRITHFTGYLDQRPRLDLWQTTDAQQRLTSRPIETPFALCVVGGGQDGADLATAFALAKRPDGMSGIIVTGPYMPADAKRAVKEIAARDERLTVIEFFPEVDALLSRADRVVSMGGYNTVCSVLSHRKPALVVPRVWPRTEQFVRAERLRDAGLISMLHPAELTAAAVRQWLHSPIAERAYGQLNLRGLSFIQSSLLRHVHNQFTLTQKSTA